MTKTVKPILHKLKMLKIEKCFKQLSVSEKMWNKNNKNNLRCKCYLNCSNMECVCLKMLKLWNSSIVSLKIKMKSNKKNSKLKKLKMRMTTKFKTTLKIRKGKRRKTCKLRWETKSRSNYLLNKNRRLLAAKIQLKKTKLWNKFLT